MASGWVSCARVKETLVNRTTIVFTISRLKIRQSMIQKKAQFCGRSVNVRRSQKFAQTEAARNENGG